MATKLKRLKLTELSLVDSPANRSAHITIFKCAQPDDEPPAISFRGDPKEIRKAHALMQMQLDEAERRIDAYFGREPEEKLSRGVKKMNTFMSAVTRIQQRDNITKHAAMSRARMECPDEFEAFQQQEAPVNTRAQAIAKGHDRQERIRSAQREIQKRDNVDGQQALRTLREERGAAFFEDGSDDYELDEVLKRISNVDRRMEVERRIWQTIKEEGARGTLISRVQACRILFDKEPGLFMSRTRELAMSTQERVAEMMEKLSLSYDEAMDLVREARPHLFTDKPHDQG